MEEYTPNAVAGMISAYKRLSEILERDIGGFTTTRAKIEYAITRYESNIPQAVRTAIWSGGGGDLLERAKGRLETML